MKKITIDKISVDNIIDIMIEPNRFDGDNYVYKDIYSVLQKNGSRKEIDKGDYKALLKILEVREFGRN